MESRTLFVVRDAQKFIVRYPAGEERETIETIHRQAQDPGHPLTWRDAVRLCLQLGDQMQERSS